MAIKKKLPEPEPEPEPDNNEEEEEEEEESEEEESEEEDSEEEESEEEESKEEVESEKEEVESEEESKEEVESEEEESDEDLSNRETLRALLEPFGKDQLIELLKEAAARNPSLLSRISESAESDPVHRKIFVHGIWDCTTETLAASFRPFGDIEECHIVSDRTTGRCKGYGFVLFRTRRGARNALKEPQKIIGGRPTTSQLASKGNSPAAAADGGSGRKVYVSNVGTNVNPERLKAFFARFGEIEEGPLGYDKASGKLHGYAIFVYKTAEGCKKALDEPVKVFDGCILQCRRALEGVKPMVPGAMTVPAVSALPPNDIALTYASSYGSPAGGLLGQEMGVQSGGVGWLNPVGGQSGGAGWLNPVGGQSGGVGLLNPVAGVSLSANRSVTPTSYVAGTGVNTVSPNVIGSYQSQAALQGLGGYQPPTSYGAGTGVNTLSPSVIGSYQSQVALQGLGGYQSQSGMNPGMRSQSSLGSSGSGLPSYLGR